MTTNDAPSLDEQVAREVMGMHELVARDFGEQHGLATRGDGMLLVLEQMRELGWTYTLIAVASKTDYSAGFAMRSEREVSAIESGGSLPEAVAIAALAAVRAQP